MSDSISVGTGPKRRGVEFPDRLRYPGAVVVDQDVHITGGLVTGEVDLADRRDGKRFYIGHRVEPEVPRADVDVVDIA